MRLYYWLDRRLRKKWQEVTDQSRDVLSGQQITSAGPGTILKEIEMLIDFVSSQKVVSQGKNGTFPMDLLPELNRRSSFPIRLELKRALLRDYPNLAGLFILLRVTELFQIQGRQLVVSPIALDVWRTLNPAEQYFALLEALCFEAQSSVLGGPERREEVQAFDAAVRLLAQLGLGGKWRDFHLYDATYRLGPQGEVPPWNLFLLQHLGLLELRRREVPRNERNPRSGFGWVVGGARLTGWGKAVTWNLLEFATTNGGIEFDDEPENFEPGWDQPQLGITFADEPSKPPVETASLADEDEDDPEVRLSFGALQEAFQPYFPEWQKCYRRPQAKSKLGTHIYKVTLTGWRGGGGGIWCRLAVPTGVSLDTLAGAILDAFNLDEDHMYDFRYRDHRGQARVYYHPYSDEGPWTPEILVEETELPLNGVMRFLFDYGDRWEFDVRLEAVQASSRGLDGPRVIESAGEAPEQYPGSGD